MLIAITTIFTSIPYALHKHIGHQILKSDITYALDEPQTLPTFRNMIFTTAIYIYQSNNQSPQCQSQVTNNPTQSIYKRNMMAASITLNAPWHSTMVSGCYPLHYFLIVQYTIVKLVQRITQNSLPWSMTS